MASVDRVRNLQTIAPVNGAASDGVRQFSVGENNKRTERYLLRVSAVADITVGGTGLSNRGSILGALRDVGFVDGGADKYVTDARLARFIGECMAPSALPATRLAAAGIQTVTLSETIPLWLCAARTANPNETKYVEVNKQLAQQVFVVPNKLITGVANGAALAGTIEDMSVTVEQVYDDLVGVPPWYSLYQRQLVQDVVATNPALRIDLRGGRFVRGIAIQQDTDQGEVSDIINAVVLRGDRESLLGDRAIPFVDLQEHAAEEFGGALPPGYLFIDFARYGRLSAMWNPYQDVNLRFELDVQPSVTLFGGAAATGSRVRVALVEFERTAATNPNPPIRI